MHTNRLIHEKSPYLLQHAHNPVDWYAWGPEAFEKARTEEKPIFLSIGYSTCHWCHVMERESFENDEIAELLNRHFVPVKVDREERPDVDRIYMLFVQATTGGGGWPMSVWLTPDLKPFYGGTYFPPTSRWGRPGFREVLTELAKAWANDRERVEDAGDGVLAQLQKHVSSSAAPASWQKAEIADAAFNTLRQMFDTRLGGFGQAPKFPRPVAHNFLVRYAHHTGKREALDMVLHTLKAMRKGGMYDQAGGGFHRYSVDEYWFVPHFEKMLYDQAQLAISYLEAYQLTRDNSLAESATGIFSYVLRDLLSPERAFYSAEDADSVVDPANPQEKGEGAFYIWTADELRQLLGETRATWFAYRYGVQDNGNVTNDQHGEFTGRNILFESHTIDETASHFRVSAEEMRRTLDQCCALLMDARAKRVRPHLDDKILTAWNGLMISAFALGGRVLDEPRYISAARDAANFILTRMYDRSTSTLLRRYRDGEAAIPAFLDDYTLFVQGLLDLYESCFDLRYLDAAVALTERQIELFEDRDNGGFFSSDAADDHLILRLKDDYDGAEPSGNSTAALNLLRLSRITGREDFRRSADRTLAAFAEKAATAGVAMPQMLVAMMFAQSAPKEIVIAGERANPGTRALLDALWRRFEPDAVVILANEAARNSRVLPGVRDKLPVEGSPAAYVCRNFACQLPVTTVDGFIELLK